MEGERGDEYRKNIKRLVGVDLALLVTKICFLLNRCFIGSGSPCYLVWYICRGKPGHHTRFSWSDLRYTSSRYYSSSHIINFWYRLLYGELQFGLFSMSIESDLLSNLGRPI